MRPRHAHFGGGAPARAGRGGTAFLLSFILLAIFGGSTCESLKGSLSNQFLKAVGVLRLSPATMAAMLPSKLEDVIVAGIGRSFGLDVVLMPNLNIGIGIELKRSMFKYSYLPRSVTATGRIHSLHNVEGNFATTNIPIGVPLGRAMISAKRPIVGGGCGHLYLRHRTPATGTVGTVWLSGKKYYITAGGTMEPVSEKIQSSAEEIHSTKADGVAPSIKRTMALENLRTQLKIEKSSQPRSRLLDQ